MIIILKYAAQQSARCGGNLFRAATVTNAASAERCRLLRRLCRLPLVALPVVLAGCSGAPSMLSPHSDRARTILTTWWVMLGIGAVIYVIVVGAFVVAAVRPGQQRAAGGSGRRDYVFMAVAGAIIPAVILVVVFGLSIHAMSAFDGPSSGDPLTVEVIGHDWWWEIRYPDSNVTTANELHIPVGQQVLLKVTSADVIHSFWVPQLQAKQDVIPGQTNTLWLDAADAGSYRGQCAEYCGLQHANMAFFVIAEPPAQFSAWLQQESQAAAQPADPTAAHGEQVFMQNSCEYCHAIKGTQAGGREGPDLTHIASRQMIGAGTLVNSAGTLGGWIANPQELKPDVNMPPSQLSGADLQALVAYLESLK